MTSQITWRPQLINFFFFFKVVVNALFSAIPGIGNVLLVSILFWLIFSILGVQLFAGKFYKCVDPMGERESVYVVPNKTECLKRSGYRWINSNVNFDNVINGFLALFQVVSIQALLSCFEGKFHVDSQTPNFPHDYFDCLF